MRLFIGIPVPEDLRSKINESLDSAEGMPDKMRRISPESWHMTLAFLDEVNEERLDPLREMVEQAVARPPGGRFSIQGLETFPNRRPSMVIAKAAPATDAKWNDFVHDMRDLVSIIAPNVDRKPWHPHITVCRSRRGAKVQPWNKDLEAFDWKPTKISLVKSEPQQDGSKYTILHDFPIDL